MFIEFRIRNFRSLKEEQVFSLVPTTTDVEHAETHLIATSAKLIPKLLKSAVIYGANASGKTNLINALFFMRTLVAESATAVQLGQTFNIQPFRLDTEMLKKPIEFEITFLVEGIRYQYGFTLTSERIYEEWLLVYKTSKPQQWFSRKYNENTDQDEYEFSTAYFTGKRKLWQESTRPNGLFLSTAVHLNSEQLRPVFKWIVQDLVIFRSGFLLPSDSVTMLQNKETKRNIEAFMISADISITNIEVVSKKGYSQKVELDLTSGKTTSFQKEESELLHPQFYHKTEHGSATFELQEESLGTQRFFYLSGPILDILNNGSVLIVDELDSSLHPLLLKRILSIFHDPKYNKKGAQLIFTTHDTSLLNKDIFRRDQIWFFEKDREQASTIFPLTDFSPRKNEALENGYLIGRYGAIPFFNDDDM